METFQSFFVFSVLRIFLVRIEYDEHLAGKGSDEVLAAGTAAAAFQSLDLEGCMGDAIRFLISSMSTPSGTASMLILMLSPRSFHVDTRTIAAIARLIIGSMTVHPVNLITKPEMTTPMLTRVSVGKLD